jgi:hypothetical protein
LSVLTYQTPLSDIRSWISRGYAGGTWKGAGIISSSADASHGVAYIQGNPQLTISLARYGDANLDRQVNFADLLALVRHYRTNATAMWSDGDFNYDGNVDFRDLLMLAQNYGKPLTTLLAGADPRRMRSTSHPRSQ